MLGDEPDGWHFDRDARAISQREWGRLRTDVENCRVAQSQIGPVWISTVWIGLDVGVHGPDSPPLIFETMAFLGEGDDVDDPLDEFTYRYPTEDDARCGHEIIVSLVRKTLRNADDVT